MIRNESVAYNDILMIDTLDNYKNLLYKHLSLINWLNDYCESALFVVKLDDDVFVNIKSLSKHLLEKFSLTQTRRDKFLYCNVHENALPQRINSSKWYVDYESYPFDWYPRYCEGFAYITNINTIKLMHEQSQKIPRFWIDDVYFTGLLLYGLDDIKWYDYKNLKFSYYDYWDLGNTLTIYELYAFVLKFFNINAVDFYASDYFIILHSHVDHKEIDYRNFAYLNQNFGQNRSLASNPGIRVYSSLTLNDNTNKTAQNSTSFCINLIYDTINNGLFNTTWSSSSTSSTTVTTSTLSSDYYDCLKLIDDRKLVLNFYFYEFCFKLWSTKNQPNLI